MYSCSPGGSVGRQGPSEHPRSPQQCQMGAVVVTLLELSGVGRVVEGGTDTEEAWAAKLDGWIV